MTQRDRRETTTRHYIEAERKYSDARHNAASTVTAAKRLARLRVADGQSRRSA